MTIASIALTGASAVANSMAQSKVNRAREDVMAAERTRQRGLDEQAAAINLRSQDRYQDFGGQQDARSQKLGDYFQQQRSVDPNADPSTAGMAAPISGSNVTVQEELKQRGKARASTDKQGAALGELRSFSDLLGEVGRGQARDAGYVGQVGGAKKGFAALIPNELENANSAGNGMKMFGDLLGMAGKATMGAGLYGEFIPPKVPGASPLAITPGGSPLTIGKPMGGLPSFAQRGSSLIGIY